MSETDFDIDVRKRDGQFELDVDSPGGKKPIAASDFPYSGSDLKLKLTQLELALSKSSGLVRRGPTTEEQAAQDFGRDLFAWLMQGDVRALYARSMTIAEQQDRPLRVRITTDVPAIAALPWEFLWDPDRGQYVVLSAQTPVIRYPELGQSIETLAVTPPLRILGMTAQPKDMPELNADGERARIETATRDLQDRGLLAITWLESGSWRDLQAEVRRVKPHIFHFVGHGGYDQRNHEGFLCFVSDEGLRDDKSGSQVSLLLQNRSLRLVILNACEGANGSDHDVFSSSAATLIQSGIPAVIAMQYAITDGAATEFSQSFYGALIQGLAVDEAVAEGRKGIALKFNDSLEWATPVLFMRSPDGVLFDVAAPPATTEPTRPRPVEGEAVPEGRDASPVPSGQEQEGHPTAAADEPHASGVVPPPKPPWWRGVSRNVVLASFGALAAVVLLALFALPRVLPHSSPSAQPPSFIPTGTPIVTVGPTMTPEDEALRQQWFPSAVGCYRPEPSSGGYSSEMLAIVQCPIDSPLINRATVSMFRTSEALDGRWAAARRVTGNPPSDSALCWNGAPGESAWSGGHLQCDYYQGKGDAELRWTDDLAFVYGTLLGDQTATIGDVMNWWQANAEPYAKPPSASATPGQNGIQSPIVTAAPTPTATTTNVPLSPGEQALKDIVPVELREPCVSHDFPGGDVTGYTAGLQCDVDRDGVMFVKYAAYANQAALESQWADNLALQGFAPGLGDCPGNIAGENSWTNGRMECHLTVDYWVVRWTDDPTVTYGAARAEPGMTAAELYDWVLTNAVISR